MVLPVLVVRGRGCGRLFGVALQSRPLYASAFVGIAMSGAMFVMLPIIFMSRGSRRRIVERSTYLDRILAAHRAEAAADDRPFDALLAAAREIVDPSADSPRP